MSNLIYIKEDLKKDVIELCALINQYANKKDLVRTELYKGMLKSIMQEISQLDYELLDECQNIINTECADYIQEIRNKYRNEAKPHGQ